MLLGIVLFFFVYLSFFPIACGKHIGDSNHYFSDVATDLDKASTAQVYPIPDISNITYYTLPERKSLTPERLADIFIRNAKSVIHILDSNTTIVPTDQILNSDSQKLLSLDNLFYLEVKHNILPIGSNYIPLSSCVSARAYNLELPSIGVSATHRVAVASRFTVAVGSIVGVGYLLNTTTIALSFGDSVKFKLVMERSIETLAACYLVRNEAARLFGYVTLWKTEPLVREIAFMNWKQSCSGVGKEVNKREKGASVVLQKRVQRGGQVENGAMGIDGREERRVDGDGDGGGDSIGSVVVGDWSIARTQTLLGNEPIAVFCNVGSRKELMCDLNKGSIADQCGHEMMWKILY